MNTAWRPLAMAALAWLCLAGCQQTTSKVLAKASQKSAISQGNLMFRENIARVRLGMSKEEVRFILGTPLLTGTFDEDRWYYLFYLNLRPLDSAIVKSPEIRFDVNGDEAKWEEYWRSPEPASRYGKGAIITAEGLGDDEGPAEPGLGEDGGSAEPGEAAASAESEEDLTRIRRDRFVESRKGYIAGSKIVFYGRLTLSFERNRLASIALLEAPEIAPQAGG